MTHHLTLASGPQAEASRGLTPYWRCCCCPTQFEIVRAPLPPQLSRAYEQSCHLWQYLHEAVINNQKERSRIAATYWGAHQRFFKSLFVAAKVTCT